MELRNSLTLQDKITELFGFKHALSFKKRDFPGSPEVKSSPPNAGGAGSIPGWGAKIPHASWPKKPKHKTEAIL